MEAKLKEWMPKVSRYCKRLCVQWSIPIDEVEDMTQEGMIGIAEVLAKNPNAPDNHIWQGVRSDVLNYLDRQRHCLVKKQAATGKNMFGAPVKFFDKDECESFQKILVGRQKVELQTKDLMLIMTALAFKHYPIRCSATLIFSDRNSWYFHITQALGKEARAIRDELQDRAVDSWLHDFIPRDDKRSWHAIDEIRAWEPEIEQTSNIRKLAQAEIELISKAYRTGCYTYADLGSAFDVDGDQIHMIVSGKRTEQKRVMIPDWIKNCVVADREENPDLSFRFLGDKYGFSNFAASQICKSYGT